MAEKKYQELIFEEPIVEGEFAPKIGLKDLEGLDIRIAYNCVSEPFFMIKNAHKHEHAQYLCFIGGNPMDIRDFGAEVELTLGADDDQEKHIIDTPSIVYIPKGLPHLPMVYKKLDKPVFFGHLLMAPDYVETRL